MPASSLRGSCAIALLLITQELLPNYVAPSKKSKPSSNINLHDKYAPEKHITHFEYVLIKPTARILYYRSSGPSGSGMGVIGFGFGGGSAASPDQVDRSGDRRYMLDAVVNIMISFINSYSI